MEDFKDYKQIKEEKYKQDSRDRLGKILKKKVETTMIGALASVEQNFGFLWNAGGEMTPEQEKMYDLYQKIRSEILDKGNSQARNIDVELSQYEVKWLRYSITIPVKNV
jgi:transcription termination factor Rho